MAAAYNPGMKRMAAILSIVALVACASSGDPEKAVKQYRAWCFSKSRPLSDWMLTREPAEALVKEHLKLWPHHQASVKVWTGDPAVTGAK